MGSTLHITCMQDLNVCDYGISIQLLAFCTLSIGHFFYLETFWTGLRLRAETGTSSVD
jgi:hypothetical protein